MSCERWQELVALDAGGDLPEAEVPALKAHLVGCERCAALASELRALVSDLGRLRATSTDAEAAAEVRAAVLRAVAGERLRRLVGPTWWLAAAALLAAAGVGLWVGSGREPDARRPVVEGRAPTVAPVPSAVEARPPTAQAAPGPAAGARIALARPRKREVAVEPVLVKVVTSDPDVVFYLVRAQGSGT